MWFLERAPSTLSRIAALVGIVCMIDGVWPHHWRVLSAFSPMLPRPARAAAAATVAVAGLLLLWIASGLRRRKRAAWLIAVVACVAIATADLVRPERRLTEGCVTVALLVALVVARSRFSARGDPRSRWAAARVAAEFVAFAIGYGLVLLYLPGRVPDSTTFGARLREVLLSMVGFGGTLAIRSDHFADALHATLFGFGALTIVCALVLLLRAVEPVAILSSDDEARLRDLLRRHGARDSLGYFALRRDKSVVWSPTGRAAITYRVVRGVALVSGDPIGDPEAWPGAIAAYRRLVDDYGWLPAVVGCSELGAIVFRRECGMSALHLGDEAIVAPAEFSLTGRAMRGTRQACGRMERAGYDVEIRHTSALSAAELDVLRTVAARWRVDPIERGYSMALSRLGDPLDGDCLVVTARQDGRLRGLLHFVPWSEHGISLDLMRRDHDADNGLNEFMICTVLRACPYLDICQVSLNFAVFRDPLERGKNIGAGPILRLWRRILLLASRWWQIESLYRFNAKFQPRWEPRFISYAAARDLPRVALAAMEAEAFFAPPRILNRLTGRG